ncbi:MAG: glycosyltransferase [Bacteroidetes bacterium]|nr:glycosyltransferase [Bacteroidota bacterium]
MKKTLFLFTKKFPFDRQEKYISDELSFLAEKFSRIIIIPSEYFDEERTPVYPLPSNTEILLINKLPGLSGAPKKHWGEFLSVFFSEFFSHPKRKYFFRFTKRYASILLYQQASADAFTKWLNENKIDIGNSVFYTYWLHNSSLMLALLKKRNIIRYFFSRAHSIDLYNEWWPGISEKMTPLPFMMFKLKWIDKVAAISEHGCLHLKKYYPSYVSKFTYARLGVDDLGERKNRSGKEFTVVTCSNLSANKRIQRMPGILSRLKIPVRWIHYGGEGIALEELIKQTSLLSSNIKSDLRGFTNNAIIAKEYAEGDIDLFINLSRCEGIPVSIMEAQRFGIPSMATAVYGTPEIVNEENGHLLPEEFSDEEAAGFISSLAGDLELQKKLSENSRRHFLKYFLAPSNFRDFISRILLF